MLHTNSTKYARLKILLLQMGLEPTTTSAITIAHDDIIVIASRQLALVLFMHILYICITLHGQVRAFNALKHKTWNSSLLGTSLFSHRCDVCQHGSFLKLPGTLVGSGVQLAVRDYILPLWILCHQTPLNDRDVRELCEGLHRNTNTTILHVVEVVVILLRNCRPPA